MKYVVRFAFLLIITLVSHPLNAQHSWIGSDGDWDDPTNWSTGNVPLINDDAVIDTDDAVKVFVNPGFVNEVGTLHIGDSATLRIEDGANLDVESSGPTNAIICYGLLSCWGNLTITGSNAYAVHVYGELIVRPSGVLHISGDMDHGIRNHGRMTNRGKCTIDLDQPLSEGLHNSGLVINYDTIRIDIDGSLAFQNEDSTYNDTSGVIIIGKYGNTGIENDGLFQNYGEIDIDSSTVIDPLFTEGIENRSEFYNAGILTVDARLSSRGIFTNAKSGVITCLSSTNDGLYLTYGSNFINHGGILIGNSADKGLYNDGTFFNDSLIVILISGGDGFYNRDSLQNAGRGEILIANSGRYGYYNWGETVNGGILTISGTQGDGLYNRSPLWNRASGEITILDGGSDGIYNNSDILNHGLIKIDSTRYDGISNRGEISNDGEITVSKTETGIDNGALLVNMGGISVDQSQNGIDNGDSLINHDSILIHSCNTGFKNQSYTAAAAESFLQIQGADSEGFINTVNGHFLNDGMIEVQNAPLCAFLNQGDFTNNNFMIIEGPCQNPFETMLNAVFSNNGSMDVLP